MQYGIRHLICPPILIFSPRGHLCLRAAQADTV
uniref:Uncharacterized protein n=1 Tax=Siphoviridae sp. ct91l7 TaxID=2826173 RepID=A0A8S5MX86_9CAUD|nr:MAG TPA: hypothetical protein [Siphoviridae sp. ct91l7]